jgi:hypothetical protein
MHQMMIDQSKVLANTIQNYLPETLKKAAEGGIPRIYIFPTKSNSSSVPKRPIGFPAD